MTASMGKMKGRPPASYLGFLVSLEKQTENVDFNNQGEIGLLPRGGGRGHHWSLRNNLRCLSLPPNKNQ